NVIVFGESGVGKSSVINMLTGEPVAAVSNQAVGCTYESTKYRATIDGREVMLYDTAGLNEAEAGTVSPQRAIQNLRSLVEDLKTVNLLVYCIRGTRFRKIVADNYNIFRRMICGRARGPKVPIVLVITGLENEDNMDDWWKDNRAYFDQYKMEFCGHVCITATRGRALKDGSRYIFQDLYDTSKEKVMELLADNAFRKSIQIVPHKDNQTPMRGVSSSPNPGRITSILRWCEERSRLRE
ncbi:P-loop containing nucleoside triphosphate hydrolase protein, partial [Rhizopogon vinicolor AM-OR11-026]